jgi:hypothetical protein
MIAKIAEEIPQNIRNRFHGAVPIGREQTGVQRTRCRAATTSCGISEPAQINPICMSIPRQNSIPAGTQNDRSVRRLVVTRCNCDHQCAHAVRQLG